MGAFILSGIIGMWISAILSYLMVIRPLIDENEKLNEIIHQQTKIGFYKEDDNE